MSTATPLRSGHAPHDLTDLVVELATLLGAGSTIFYQLAEKGVAEHSTALERPLDRLRATMAYVYVAVLGTEEERRAVVRLVNEAHAPVRSPGRYSAFDRDLQLWVAATLVHNTIFVREKCGVSSTARAGTASTRQRRSSAMRSRCAPSSGRRRSRTSTPTGPSWSPPWSRTLSYAATATPCCVPVAARPSSAPLLSLLDRGNLDSRTREVLGFVWTARDQRRYDLF